MVVRPGFDWGDFRRPGPFSDTWGADRGTPIDRVFIDRFLGRHRADVRGHVLEVEHSIYTDRFGQHVSRADVLDVDPTNASATIVADLAQADPIPSHRFDCFILTQTLQFIYDVPAALRHAGRILKPGGVLLASVPAVSRMAPEYADGEREYWRFTEPLVRRLFGAVFGADGCEVATYGNARLATAFLYGLAAEDTPPEAFDVVDAACPLLFCVRAVSASPARPAAPRSARGTP